MALVTTKKMFEKAFEGGYAIGAFNINNMEIIQGVVAAAKAQTVRAKQPRRKETTRKNPGLDR